MRITWNILLTKSIKKISDSLSNANYTHFQNQHQPKSTLHVWNKTDVWWAQMTGLCNQKICTYSLCYISPKGPLCSAFRVMQKSTQVSHPNTSSVVLCPHLIADRLWHRPHFWADDYYGGSVNSPDTCLIGWAGVRATERQTLYQIAVGSRNVNRSCMSGRLFNCLTQWTQEKQHIE